MNLLKSLLSRFLIFILKDPDSNFLSKELPGDAQSALQGYSLSSSVLGMLLYNHSLAFSTDGS
jgi:hypothetical protein